MMGAIRPFPIIEYARKIGKNTAEFTAIDFVKFMKWWMKQPIRKDLAMVDFKKHLKKNESDWRNNMNDKAKNKFPVDQEMVDESEVEEMTEEMMQEQTDSTEVVCELGLTKKDVQALVWGLGELLSTYNFSESLEIGETLANLKEALDGVELGE